MLAGPRPAPASSPLDTLPLIVRTSSHAAVPDRTPALMSPDAAFARTSPRPTASMAMSPEAVRMRRSAGASTDGDVAGARLDLQRAPPPVHGDVARPGLHRRRPGRPDLDSPDPLTTLRSPATARRGWRRCPCARRPSR